ncbi:MAG: hypothetical protein LBJ24_05265 [Treponema sp.]|jgi:hypothetical protein|nr:hypothetical protein [Treponema sp.]
MADKKTPLFVFLVLAAFIPPLFGQKGEGSSFYIERTEEGERFIQRLFWDEVRYAYRYEVNIEVQGSGDYRQILREFREENFIELSLVPGSYRYRIRAYNILNQPSENSEWVYFRVLPALQPELYSYTQGFSRSSSEGSGDLTEIILHGMNLQEGADVYLASLETAASPVRPLDYLPREEGARLVFTAGSLPPGRYRVYVRNPGGLESSLEITVAPPSIAGTSVPDNGAPAGTVPGAYGERSFHVQAEYAPVVPLYGYLFDHFGKDFYPLGASLRFGVLPFKKPRGGLGLEAAAHWTTQKTTFEGSGQTAHLGALRLNGIYQRRLYRQLFLNLRMGGGISFVYGTNEGGENAGSIFTWMPSASGGVSLRWFIRESFYIETGAEYVHIFSVDDPSPGYILPVIGAGLAF